MKKKLFFLPLVAALALAGCSNEDLPGEGGENGGEGDASTHYLSVCIVSNESDGGRSRAETDERDGNSILSGYEDGTGLENEVKKVRFYFFNSSGDAVAVKRGESKNYYDWEAPTVSGTGGDNTVEKQLNAILLIETSKGDALPGQILAVVNPDENFLGDANSTNNRSKNLDDLRNLFSDYAGRVYNTTNPKFTMTNSVYRNFAGDEVEAQIVRSENYASNEEEAKNVHPVMIYVERNVAKVRVTESIGFDATTGLAVVKDSQNSPIVVEATTIADDGTATTTTTNIYVKFNGWNLTGTLPYGYLSKHINTAWANDYLGTNIVWNDPSNFRSYWADNCPNSRDNVYISYNDMNAWSFNGTDSKVNYAYCNENGEHPGKKTTQIIVSATLCDSEGKAITLAEYAGVRFISKNGNLDGLKRAYLFQLNNRQLNEENSATVYYKGETETNSDGTTNVKYTPMSEGDITFKTAAKAELKDFVVGADAGGYYVYPRLTDAAKNATWYIQSDQGMVNIDVSQITNKLKDLLEAKIWNNGNTYYFTDIKHFNKSGVVRNHVYNINLTGVVGLGTPVFDPTEIIYPEIPVKSNTYIAAKINILSWRVVTYNVVLNGEEK